MAKRSKSTTKSAKRSKVGAVLGALSFDVTIRTDKLRAWLANHPGENPPGLSAVEVSAILGD